MPEFYAVVFGYPSQPPKFALTQRVQLTYKNDDGEIHTEQGFIVGVMYDPTMWLDHGWSYLIATYQFDYESTLELPHYDSVHESELIALNY